MGEAHLFRNGRVFTGSRYAEALLEDGGEVLAVGPEVAVRRDAPTGALVHDLEGGLVLPGLIDAHLHLGELARVRERFDARPFGSLPELAEALRRWVVEHPSGTIVGYGWEVEQFREGRGPDRALLDRVVDGRPALLLHTSGHLMVVNSAALASAGIERTTRDPPGGRLGRDPDGVPNGWLYEEAMELLGPTPASSPPDPAVLRSTLLEAASLGLTTVATMNTGRAEATALKGLAEAGQLPVRVRVYLRLSELDRWSDADLTPAGPPGMYSVPGAKEFTDGAFGPRTAWLSEPYSDAPGETGVPLGSEAEISSALDSAARRGLAPALHAIGDRAVERAVRLLAPYAGRAGAPPRVEHAALTPPAVLPELDRVRPALVVQPGFVLSDAWLGARLGRERARWAYAFRTLIDRGHRLAASSDAPFDPLDPWRGLLAAVQRADPLGRSANPETSEALPMEEALRLYTGNGGDALGEPELGRLEPGARADLVWVEAPDLPGAFVAGARAVQETWVGGRCLYARTGTSGKR